MTIRVEYMLRIDLPDTADVEAWCEAFEIEVCTASSDMPTFEPPAIINIERVV